MLQEKPKISPDIYPDFQKLNTFTSLKLYRYIGFEETQEIKIEEKLKKELFDKIKNNLKLGYGGRFNSTKEYKVIVDDSNDISYEFIILLENKVRSRIIFNNHTYHSQELLEWFIENNIKR